MTLKGMHIAVRSSSRSKRFMITQRSLNGERENDKGQWAMAGDMMNPNQDFDGSSSFRVSSDTNFMKSKRQTLFLLASVFFVVDREGSSRCCVSFLTIFSSFVHIIVLFPVFIPSCLSRYVAPYEMERSLDCVVPIGLWQ